MLKGRKAIITGSTSGIGEGMARALAAEGADVMLNGSRDAASIEELRSGMAMQYGVTVLYNSADLSKADECEALVRDAEKRLGAVDILVNNAGIQFVAPIEDFPVDRWNQIIAINLSSTFHTIRAALPGMKKRGWGRLVNISSAHGLVASGGKVAYVAAKHGIIGITQTVALETAKTGITCNAICPGWVLTPLVERQIKDRSVQEGIDEATAKSELLSEKEPSGRFTTADDIGALAVYLCSESAQNLTGASIPIDGGWTAQ